LPIGPLIRLALKIPSTTATVEINNDAIKALNADKKGNPHILKLKFPVKK